MNWTTPRDLKAQLMRLWLRGELLRPLIGNEQIFPLQLKLKAPVSADLTGCFEAVRAWIAELTAMPQIRIEWHTVRHRVQGMQHLPHSVWIDTADSAFGLLAKQRDVKRFEHIVDVTRSTQPALLSWLARRPLQAIELADQWPRLLAIVHWLAEHPHPGIYLRQVDIPAYTVNLSRRIALCCPNCWTGFCLPQQSLWTKAALANLRHATVSWRNLRAFTFVYLTRTSNYCQGRNCPLCHWMMAALRNCKSRCSMFSLPKMKPISWHFHR